MSGSDSADDARNFNHGVALSSSIYPNKQTHIEPFTYGPAGNFQSVLFAMAPRSAGVALVHCILRSMRSGTAAILACGEDQELVETYCPSGHQQSLDNSIRLRVKFVLPGGFPVLTTEQAADNPNPDYIPEGYHAANWIAQRVGGVVQAMAPEAALAIPTTGHLLGGAESVPRQTLV